MAYPFIPCVTATPLRWRWRPLGMVGWQPVENPGCAVDDRDVVVVRPSFVIVYEIERRVPLMLVFLIRLGSPTVRPFRMVGWSLVEVVDAVGVTMFSDVLMVVRTLPVLSHTGHDTSMVARHSPVEVSWRCEHPMRPLRR